MSLPTYYTEESLAQFMHTSLGAVASFLGYAQPEGDAGTYTEAVNQVSLEAAVTDLTQAADLKQLRALAGLFAWRKACADLATHYNFMVEGNRYQRGEVLQQASEALRQAETDALPYQEQYRVSQLTPVPASQTDPFGLG